MSSFADTLAGWGRGRPDKTAVLDDRRRLTYGELDALVTRVAGNLAAVGVRRGDVVTSQLANCVEAMAVCLAANRIGAIHNPVATIYRDREIGFIREQAASAVFIDGADHEVLVAGSAADLPAGEPTADAPRFLLYTSGSTSDPKGVLHSDATLGAECRAQVAYHGLTAHEVFVMPSPVGHVSGLLYGILLPMWLGATSVLMSQWDPGRFLELVQSEGGTFSGGATPFLQGIADHPDLARFDTTSLRIFPCGGAEVPPDLIRRAARRLGVRTGRGYGSTEFPSITSAAGPGEPEEKRAETDGRPIGTNRIRIVDGEIHARGRELFLGYLDARLDVDAFTHDRWFRTGDLGHIDEDGYLTVTGRLKDVIIRSGEKISAGEIEELLSRHPAVVSVAVVGRADPDTGERTCACIVPRHPDQPPTLEELATFLTELGLSTRKFPEEIEILPSLPLTASGKVDKPRLRAARS